MRGDGAVNAAILGRNGPVKKPSGLEIRDGKTKESLYFS